MKALFVASLVACGGESTEMSAAHPPPREVLTLGLHVDGEDAFCGLLEGKLLRSGLSVQNDNSANVDATLTCHTETRQDDSWLQVSNNGHPKRKFVVRVDVTGRGGVRVDQFRAEYKGFEGDIPDEDAVNKVVLAFAYSPRIASFARQTKSLAGSVGATTNATAATEPTPTMTVTPPPVATTNLADHADWFRIDTVRCKIPARVDACNGVRSYLTRHPNGEHVQEAQDLLTAAQPALEKLQKDDVAWEKANVSECSSKHTADACVGVEAYQMQFPNGLHSPHAHSLLKRAGMEK